MTNEGNFIAEAIDYSSIDRNRLNIIRANCGAGKTTAALQAIPERLGFSPSSGLFLTPLNSLKEELLYSGKVNFTSLEKLRERKEKLKVAKENNSNYDRDELIDCATDEDLEKIGEKFTIMTYASFGIAVRERLLAYKDFDCIICDEVHSLLKPLGMDRAKFKKLHPDSSDLEIAEMMKIGSNMYAAVNEISLAAVIGETWVFGLTATPKPLEKINAFKGIMLEIAFVNTIQAYDTLRIFGYTSLEEIFTKPVPANIKRLFYFPLVSQEKDAEDALKEMGRNAIALWSLSHKEPMNEEQLKVRDYLIKTGLFPDDVQDLIINGSYELGLNIIDPEVREVYVHTGDETVREQVRGRIRHDIDEFGVYDSEGSRKLKDKEKARKERKEELSAIAQQLKEKQTIINNYINIGLGKEEKQKLINDLELKIGWPTLKKALEELEYEITTKQIKKDGKQPVFSFIDCKQK